MSDKNDPLYSVNALRREYFAAGSRPTKAKIERWILFGVADGLRLDALKIDGAFYVRKSAFEAFLASQRAPRVEVRRRQSEIDRRVEAALAKRDALFKTPNARRTRR